MEKQKILYIATEYAPGMIPFAVSIIKIALEQNIYEAYAFCVESEVRSYENALSFGKDRCFFYKYPTSKFKKLTFKFYPYEIFRKINRIIKEKQINKVHLLTGDFSLSHMRFSSLLANEDIYYTVHDLHPHTSNSMSWLGELLHKHVLRATKRLIRKVPNLTTCSDVQLQELKLDYPNKNVTFTHFPSLVTDEIKNGEKVIAELEDINDYILFFGTIDHYKGVDYLVEAYLKSDCRNKCKLVLAGRGKLELKDYEDVIWLNRFIQDDEIKDLFRKARIVVYPYRNITMSGVLSLAFYFGNNIICSDLWFFKQYENDSMRFFTANNVEALTQTLSQVYLLSKQCSMNVYNHYFQERNLLDDLLVFYGLK